MNPLNTTVAILRTGALLEERFSGGLGAVHGLSLKELLLLRYVHQAPGARLTRVELSKRLHVSASTVTRMTRPLEKIGIIDREPGVRDARMVYVILTPAGETLLENAGTTLQRMAEAYFSEGWSREELGALTQLLSRATAGLPGAP